MNIDRIVLILITFGVIYLLFFKKEKMTTDNTTKQLIMDHYKIDVDAIRNLSKLANDLTKTGKLKVPGGLEIDGKLTVKGESNLDSKLNVKGDIFAHGDSHLAIKDGQAKVLIHAPNKSGEIITHSINKKQNVIIGRAWDGGQVLVKNDRTDKVSVGMQSLSWGGHIFVNYKDGKHRIHLNGIGDRSEINFGDDKLVNINANKGIINFISKINNIKGETVIDNINNSKIEGVESKKIASTRRIGGFAIDGGRTTMLLIEGKYKLGFAGGDGIMVEPGENNTYMNAWTNDAWNILYLYPGWEMKLYEHDFTGKTAKIKNVRKDGFPIRFQLDIMNLGDQVSSYELKWIGY